MSSEPMVEIQGVDIIFGGKPSAAWPLIDSGIDRADIHAQTGQTVGVANATLTVHAGETLVLMGLSGSGKSTLLRAINGLNPVSRGTVRVRSHGGWCEPASCSTADLRRLRLNQVSMVFQQFGLLPWRSVASNVGFGLELAGMPARDRQNAVAKQLELVGLSDWADRPVQALSGGMQQRVGLARAFATEAPILLMDEPFSALDPLIRKRLQDELIELQGRLHRTLLFVSHDLDEALRIGSRIAIMEGGRIVQVGTPREILDNPANDYVADFVAHMNPLAFLTAADAMQPLHASQAGEDTAAASTSTTSSNSMARYARVSPDASLDEVMRTQLSTGNPLVVADTQGVELGLIQASDIHRVLLREPRS